MRTLRAADLIRQARPEARAGLLQASPHVRRQHDARREENPLTARMAALEERFKNLTETHNRMVLKFSEYTKNVSHFGGKTEQLDRWFGDHEVWLTSLDDRIRALEPQAAPVDPLYTDIKQYFTDTLGSRVSPELLCTMIDEAYAERKK
jgi:hypothetical protein